MGAVAGGARFAVILDAMPDAIIGVDDEGLIVLVNVHAESLFGYKHHELIGQRVEVLVPSSLAEAHLRIGTTTSPDSPIRARMQTAARRKGGSEFAAEISLAASQLDGDSVLLAIVRDVTVRQRDTVKFRGVVESADDAAVGVDPGGNIALANPQAEKLFGYVHGELIDQPVDTLVPQVARDTVVRRRRKPNGDEANRQIGAGTPLAGRRKDGTEFPVEISLSAIDTKEGPLVSAAIRDASDRVETRREQARSTLQNKRDLMESQLHQSHRLESLGQLAGGVAHDFNNLLAAILNYVGFVSEEIAKEIEVRPHTERARLDAVLSDVSQIGAAAERAARLTHQLLAFARREVRNLEVLDINAVVGEVETLLRRTLGEHVELTTHGARDLKAVRADRGQIEQVLLNLAVNARDAMPNGGTLCVETENVELDDEYAALHPSLQAGPHVRVRVVDTGFGMDRETLDRAFEPFFSTKSKDQGTGLGLATVYGIVTQAAGVVDLQSEVGGGTTVTILLPSIPPEVTVPDATRPSNGHHGGETILVVEDEALVLDVASRILTQHGYRVLAARNGAEALELIESHRGPIQLLLTDVVMPGLTGKDVAERVSTVRPEIRVLYMSGYSESVITSQGVIEKGVRLVSKPFRAPDLLEHVRGVLDA
ncbi:MAG TPA: PAS domain S-box protein [Candidatus Acidoferrales bacterium]|nr:PAS domain S-box protein [Candidatus Acidoferrales bacterium]